MDTYLGLFSGKNKFMKSVEEDKLELEREKLEVSRKEAEKAANWIRAGSSSQNDHATDSDAATVSTVTNTTTQTTKRIDKSID